MTHRLLNKKPRSTHFPAHTGATILPLVLPHIYNSSWTIICEIWRQTKSAVQKINRNRIQGLIFWRPVHHQVPLWWPQETGVNVVWTVYTVCIVQMLVNTHEWLPHWTRFSGLCLQEPRGWCQRAVETQLTWTNCPAKFWQSASLL